MNPIGVRIRLSDAAALLGTYKGKPVPVQTVRNWIANGVKGASGARVKLHAVRVGGHWFTTEAWVEDFIAACTSETPPPHAEQEQRPVRGMSRKQLDRELTLRGFRGGAAKRALLKEIEEKKRKRYDAAKRRRSEAKQRKAAGDDSPSE